MGHIPKIPKLISPRIFCLNNEMGQNWEYPLTPFTENLSLHPLCKTFLRDRSRYQIGWILGNSKGGGIRKCLFQSVACFGVSQYNCWRKKHTLNPKTILLYQKALFRVPKIYNIIFWIENEPPLPLKLFWKFIRFGTAILPFLRVLLVWWAWWVWLAKLG